MIRTRFAPSPNGPLHLGHAYAAMVAHDTAHSRGGEFILRIEDIDGERSRPEFVEEFFRDLEWLGLEWDGEVVFQSHRIEQHIEVGARLKELGLLYPCRCTRADIAAAASEMGPDGPIYPGTCKSLYIEDDKVAWRLDVGKATALASMIKPEGSLTWRDECAGEQVANPQIFGDVVLLRKGLPGSYHLAATLDDAVDGITLVTRGMDLFPASHVHRLLQKILGLPQPVWLHHPLLIEGDGRKLAKRRGSPSLGDRRRAGEDGRTIIAALREGRLPAGVSLSQGIYSSP